MRSAARTVVNWLPLAFAALLAAGCASTAASVRSATPASPPADLGAYRGLTLDVTKAASVRVADGDLGRILGRIVEAIRAKQADRFQEINAPPPADPAIPTVQVTVELTRYDKGSAFARAMLAGLGQIHIDARVTVRDPGTSASLGEYDVTKTFAWGGIYGATTTIEDVEAGFAEAVATLILGR